jgi:hypothetical protein
MEELSFKEIPKFKNPEEELSFLRERLAEKEKEVLSSNQESSREELAKEVISAYEKHPAEEVMKKSSLLREKDREEIVLRLHPETHDKKMEELLTVVLEKGISNALSLVEKLNNPHIDDDFHRFLVQYLSSVGIIPGLKEHSPLEKTLKMKLFEISLPVENNDDTHKRSLKELLGAMEQFYSGMSSVSEGKNNSEDSRFALEIALSEDSNSFVFYTAVPTSKAGLFEKLLLGIHVNAKIIEAPDDYNIFSENGCSVGSYAELKNKAVFPIKLYDTLDYDPLNIILNIFTKLKKKGEGASVQLVVHPKGDSLVKKYQSVLEQVKKGVSLKDATASSFKQVSKEIGSFLKDFVSSSEKDKLKEDKDRDKKVDEKAVESLKEKIRSTIMEANIRILVSAEEKERAESILSEIEASFNQFTEADKNGFNFKRPKGGDLARLMRNFSYRIFAGNEAVDLNLKELSTIFHFPQGIVSPQLKEAPAGISPAPLDIEDNGLLLGINNYRGQETEIRMSKEDRLRHLYVIGQTGTGKTTILKNMIIQDIKNGEGCCFIDPHGTDVQYILGHIPKERIDDVIYFDPAYTPRPMGLNLLEYDPKYPEQKTFVINELLNIFNKLFDMKTVGGPMFEQYFKNSAFLAMDDPNEQATLLDITRVLTNEEYRNSLLEKCRNPIVKEFWKSALAVKGEQSLTEFVPYISSKFDNFISNDIMRPVVLQKESVFNFREIMDNKKILLVNLSKGRLGEINANLIGLLLVGKIQMAAMSRADVSYEQKMNDFYLYIDEFQNVTTDSIASILSEARKYHLSLTVAHQYVAQLEEGIKNAVFGNVGSMIVYRVSPEDANVLEPRLKPIFSASDILKLENFNSYVNMLIKGMPSKPFNMTSHYSLADRFGTKNSPEMAEKIKQLSYLKYGRPLEEVEEEIMERFH